LTKATVLLISTMLNFSGGAYRPLEMDRTCRHSRCQAAIFASFAVTFFDAAIVRGIVAGDVFVPSFLTSALDWPAIFCIFPG